MFKMTSNNQDPEGINQTYSNPPVKSRSSSVEVLEEGDKYARPKFQLKRGRRIVETKSNVVSNIKEKREISYELPAPVKMCDTEEDLINNTSKDTPRSKGQSQNHKNIKKVLKTNKTKPYQDPQKSDKHRPKLKKNSKQIKSDLKKYKINTNQIINELKLASKDESACDFEKVADMINNTKISIDYEVLLKFINLLNQIIVEGPSKNFEGHLQLIFKKRFLDAILEFMQLKTKELVKTDEGTEKCNKFFQSFLRLSVLAIRLLPASSLIFLKHTLMYTKTILCRLEGRIHDMHQHFDFQAMLNQIEEKTKMEALEREEVSPSDVENMKSMSVLPTVKDIFEKPPVLKKIIVEGAYKNTEHYLTVQFTLLHEDFIAPIREGILVYLSQSSNVVKRKTQVIVYHQIRISHASIDSGTFGHVVKFRRDTKWNIVNNIFIFGSLLLFTADNFESFFTGTVIEVNDKNKTVTVKLDANYYRVCNDIYANEFTMAVSKVFFEPYFHVLTALQNMTTEDFPMKKYIVEVNSEPQLPAYISQPELCKYKLFEGNSVDILDPNWPQFTKVKFNPSQQKAFQAALTNEFVAIQGPPGTGKTFLGLQIVSALLDNVCTNSPILIVCYKNHALDQFLEGIMKKTKQIIRIGGRSKNEKLKKFNIKEHRGPYHFGELNEFLKSLAKSYFIRKYELDGLRKHGILSLKKVHPYVSPKLIKDLLSTNFEDWLMEGVLLCGNAEQNCEELFDMNQDKKGYIKVRLSKLDSDLETSSEAKGEQDQSNLTADNNKEKFYFSEESKQRYGEMYFDDYSEIYGGVDEEVQEELLETVDDREGGREILKSHFTLTIRDLKQLRDGYERAIEQLQYTEGLDQDEMNHWQSVYQANMVDLSNRIYFLKSMLSMKISPKSRDIEKICAIGDEMGIWALSNTQRWLLYHSWVNRLAEDMRGELIKLEESIRFGEQRLDEARSEADLSILKMAKVVGVTTSGAARNRSTLNKLGAEIVIIEEAAEVLESHIVTSLSSKCQHLILIGDHKQLRPNPAVYNLCKKYNFDVSLFERMIRNGTSCHTLNVQHRMRPEFASLIVPLIYPELLNHPCTKNRSDIRGIHSNLYFIDHNHPEDQLLDTQSHVNKFEAKFVLELTNYLLLQGYLPEEISILATYSGQMKKIMKMRDQALNDVKVTTVDDFQGEENKIIILSLVRSNEEGEIGFLSTENRVCVALSRAREGLYIIGNMNCLAENSQIWPQVKESLIQHNAIGHTLSVYCQNHQEAVTLVKEAAMFKDMPEGGCTRMCEVKLGCGHVCKYHCHPRDQEHEGNYMCSVPCERTCKLMHPCDKKCGEECGPCQQTVEFDLPCNHKMKAACSCDPATLKCRVVLPLVRPCDHKTTKLCSQTDEEVGETKCHSVCNKVMECGHPCGERCHYRSVLTTCPPNVTVEKTLGCGHLHSAPCFKFGNKTTMCLVEVEKTLNCNHMKNVACGQPIDEAVCTKETLRILSCGHKMMAECGLPSNELKCREPCTKLLKCGHLCKEMCCKPCLCKTVVEKELECGHKVNSECAYNSGVTCAQPSERDLPCGHKCQDKCGVKCDVTKCQKLVPSKFKPHCGHAKVIAPCYFNHTVLDAKLKMELNQFCKARCNAQLQCGHNCRGQCGNCETKGAHAQCHQPCRAIFSCGHRCPKKCHESCGVCNQKCLNRCSHKKCDRLCGEPCNNCQEQCDRGCIHKRCSRPCFAICDRRPCFFPCPSLLHCGHPCLGFCGEPCPTLCLQCQPQHPLVYHMRDNRRVVLLEDCGHNVDAANMDAYIRRNKYRIVMCPVVSCRTPVVTTKRYHKETTEAFFQIIKVKRRLEVGGSNRENTETSKKTYENGEPEDVYDSSSQIGAKVPMVNPYHNSLTSRGRPYQPGKNGANHRDPLHNATTSRGRPYQPGQNGANSRDPLHNATTSRGRPYQPGQNGANSRDPLHNTSTSRGRPYQPGKNGANYRDPLHNATTSRGRPYQPGQNGANSRDPLHNTSTSRGRPYQPGQNGANSRDPLHNATTSRGRPYQPRQNGANSRDPLHNATTSRGRPYQPGQNGANSRDPLHNASTSRGRPYQPGQIGNTSRPCQPYKTGLTSRYKYQSNYTAISLKSSTETRKIKKYTISISDIGPQKP